jgi:hypothetical protein
MRETITPSQFYRKEGSTPRAANDPLGASQQEAKPVHQDGTMRSHHSPKTICGVQKVDGKACKGKRTTTGKCFAHSR